MTTKNTPMHFLEVIKDKEAMEDSELRKRRTSKRLELGNEIVSIDLYIRALYFLLLSQREE